MPVSLKTVAMLFAGYMLLSSCSAASAAMLAVISEDKNFENSQQVRKRKREMEDELRPLIKNLFAFRNRPQLPLGPFTDRWGKLSLDENRLYAKKLTHMFSWEIVDLHALCEHLILKPRKTDWRPKRTHASRKGRPCKVDTINRLIYVLEWLSSGDFGNKMEFEMGYSKTSLTKDRYHVLKAICFALKDEIKWPTAAERLELTSKYTGIFKDCVGIFDCTKWEISKPGENDHERRTFSGKAHTNTYKTLAVINKHGKFIYVSRLMEGTNNDRTQWVKCDLYMEPGAFFSASEKLASDGTAIYIQLLFILCSINNSSLYAPILMCLLLIQAALGGTVLTL